MKTSFSRLTASAVLGVEMFIAGALHTPAASRIENSLNASTAATYQLDPSTLEARRGQLSSNIFSLAAAQPVVTTQAPLFSFGENKPQPAATAQLTQ